MLLLLNGLVLLSLTHWKLLLNGVHDSLSIKRILLSLSNLSNWVALHRGIVESSVLTLSLIFIARILSILSLSVSYR